MAPYQYKPLNEAANEIRLLTILPGSFRSPIVVSLEAAVLTETQIPEFEALSYAWGSTKST